MLVDRLVDTQVVAAITGQPLDLLASSSHVQQMGELLIRDGLTGLYNRLYAKQRLILELQGAQRESRPIAMVLLDVNNLKRVNDTLGHAAGDKILVEVARIIERFTIQGFAARHGGDEFVIVFSGCSGSVAEQWSHTLHATLKEAAVDFGPAGRTKGIPVSIGVASWPDDAGSTPALFEAADQAMYHAKRHNGGVVQYAEAQRQMAVPSGRLAQTSSSLHLPSGTVTVMTAQLAIERASGIADSPEMLVQFQRRTLEWIERLGGKVFYQQFREGEVRAAFTDAKTAVNAGQALRQVLGVGREGGGFPLRLALHTGEVLPRNGQYEGPVVSHCVCLAAAAHPGQLVLTESTVLPIGEALTDAVSITALGMHRLRDLQRPEQIYQVVHRDLSAQFPPFGSLDALPNNLPTQLTTFVGRKHELIKIAALVQTEQLATLVGTGGTGKTRLAVHVAAALSEQFPDGVWVVELASLTDPELVVQVIADAAGVRPAPGHSIMSSLIDSLRPKQTLLVIDNCEHVLTACSTAIAELLGACQRLHILATSRSPLVLPGEVVYRVPSLSLPTLDADDLTGLYEAEATALFVERASARWPGFKLSKVNASAVISICRRLDGIPLAIELAAARVKILSLTDILARLDDQFRVLTGGNESALPRHQTLRALVDWSHNLMTAQEQLLWCRLSVFADTFAADAAAAVCESPGLDVHTGLKELVDKSILVVQEAGEQRRFRMLETIRQYGAEKLMHSGEGTTMRDRHLKWCLAVAQEADARLQGENAASTIERLRHDDDNFRAALGWSRSRHALAEDGLRLAITLDQYWGLRGNLAEIKQHLGALLALFSANTPLRASGLRAFGKYNFLQGNLEEAGRAFEGAAVICRKIGDDKGVAQSLNNLALMAGMMGKIDYARSLYEEALAITTRMGEWKSAAWILHNLGENAVGRDDYTQARQYYENSLSLKRELRDTLGTPIALCQLGYVAFIQNQYETAESYYVESLGLAQTLGDVHQQAFVLYNFAALLSEQGSYERALALANQSLQLSRDVSRMTVATALHHISMIVLNTGRLDLAESHGGECLTIMREIGSKLGIADALVVLGRVATAKRRYAEAETLLAESLELHQELKAKRATANTLFAQGILATELGHYHHATDLFKQSSAIQLDLGDKRALFHTYWRLAGVLLGQGRLDPAARVQGAAEALRRELNVQIHPCDQPEFERFSAETCRQMGERAYAKSFAEGLRFAVEEAVACAYEVSPLL